MIEHPLIMSAPMIRAYFAGQKSQTRRVVKLPNWLKQLKGDLTTAFVDHGRAFANGDYIHVPCPEIYDGQGSMIHDATVQRLFSPYDYPPGGGAYISLSGKDEELEEEVFLWFRETHASVPIRPISQKEVWWYQRDGSKGLPWPGLSPERAKQRCSDPLHPGSVTIYRADGEMPGGVPWSWTPSIFMPRRASRVFTPLLSVRAEKVQDISEEDAVDEGAVHAYGPSMVGLSAREMFGCLWNRINGKRRGYAWTDNPLVWILEFPKYKERE